VSHANARLTVHGRRLLVDRVAAGHRVSDAAAQLGCSRATAYKWLARHRAEGLAGLADRSSRPHRCPHRILAALEQRIIEARRAQRRGAEWIAAELGVAASTVGWVTARHGLPLLRELDALTGEPVRRGPASGVRDERERPGELVHIDVKKLAGIDGIGHAATGTRRGQKKRTGSRRVGYEYVHVCVDDATRLAYVEVLNDERATTAIAFLRRCLAYFRSRGIRVQRVMTDNGAAYIAAIWALACHTHRIRHLRTRPRRPRTNGKAERFIRTMLDGWAYGAIYATSAERTHSLPGWLDYYNHQRPHSSLAHQPPGHRLTALQAEQRA
jgi:transposase InsO family protein